MRLAGLAPLPPALRRAPGCRPLNATLGKQGLGLVNPLPKPFPYRLHPCLLSMPFINLSAAVGAGVRLGGGRMDDARLVRCTYCAIPMASRAMPERERGTGVRSVPTYVTGLWGCGIHVLYGRIGGARETFRVLAGGRTGGRQLVKV